MQLTLENIQTDTAKLVDIWVVDLGQETNPGWCHGIVVWKEEFELEDAPWRYQYIANTAAFLLYSPSYGDCVGPCMETSK